jgi:putative FmdB family regulatory protein
MNVLNRHQVALGDVGGVRQTIVAPSITGIESSHERGEVSMPNYEFVCKACKKNFSKVLHLAEHDRKETPCPYCGSHEVEQSWSLFSAVTSKKSA